MRGMYMHPSLFVLLLLSATGPVLLLYIMRRRVRLGKRVAKF